TLSELWKLSTDGLSLPLVHLAEGEQCTQNREELTNRKSGPGVVSRPFNDRAISGQRSTNLHKKWDFSGIRHLQNAFRHVFGNIVPGGRVLLRISHCSPNGNKSKKTRKGRRPVPTFRPCRS